MSRGSAGGRYLGFAALAAMVAAAVAAAGWWVAGSLAGDWGGPEAAVAAVAGSGIALAASLIGGIVIARPPADPRIAAMSALGATGLRLAALAALAVLVAVAGGLLLKPFLLWTAIGHFALLAVDTRYALAEARAREGAGGEAGSRP